MGLIKEQTDPERSGEREALKMDVLLVHEDLPAGWRAKHILDQVASNLEPKGDFLVNLWNFALLRDRALQARAVLDAIHADIVLLSAHGRAKWPATVRDWLKEWLNRRDGSPCALVVSLDSSFRDSAQVLDDVHRLAGQTGVEVFPHFGATPRVAWNWTDDGLSAAGRHCHGIDGANA